MTVLPHTSGDGWAGREPKATSSSRTDQHQMKADAARGNARGVMRRLTPAAHKAQDRRLGRGDAPRSLSHCRSAHVSLLPALSRRPVFVQAGTGRTFPAERICAARGAFLFTRVSDCRPARAQSLAHQQTVNSPADVLHLNALSNIDLTCWFNKCQQVRTRTWKHHPRTWTNRPRTKAP